MLVVSVLRCTVCVYYRSHHCAKLLCIILYTATIILYMCIFFTMYVYVLWQGESLSASICRLYICYIVKLITHSATGNSLTVPCSKISICVNMYV